MAKVLNVQTRAADWPSTTFTDNRPSILTTTIPSLSSCTGPLGPYIAGAIRPAHGTGQAVLTTHRVLDGLSSALPIVFAYPLGT